MATGLNSGAEAANNSMKELFEDKCNTQIFVHSFPVLLSVLVDYLLKWS